MYMPDVCLEISLASVVCWLCESPEALVKRIAVRSGAAWSRAPVRQLYMACRSKWSSVAELTFIQENISLCPHNDSSWNYLRGLLRLPDMQQALNMTNLAAFCLKVSYSMASLPSLHRQCRMSRQICLRYFSVAEYPVRCRCFIQVNLVPQPWLCWQTFV